MNLIKINQKTVKYETKNKHGGKREGAGRPKGSGYLTDARIQLLENADDIIDSLIKQAKNGDINALKLCIERIVPIAKETPLYVKAENQDCDKKDHYKDIKKRVLSGELSINDAITEAEFIQFIEGKIETGISFEELFNM